MSHDKSVVLTPKQATAWHRDLEQPDYTRVLYDGGARSTKTTVLLMWLINEAATIPGARILMARRVQDHARTTLFDLSLRDILGNKRGWKFRDQRMEVVASNGSVIRVAGLDDEDRTEKILGDEYLHAFLNEGTQMSWETVQKVISRLSQNPKGARFRKLLIDCNPRGPRHWLHQAGVLGKIPNTENPLPDLNRWKRRHWTPYDNPHLPPDVLRSYEAMTGVSRRRLLRGEWCDNEGAVYDEFDEDIHVIKGELPAGLKCWTKLRGIDFGYTNPFVRLCGATDHDGRLFIYRERYVSQVIVHEHAKAINAADKHESFMVTVADHDAEDRATLHAAGIPTIPAKKDIKVGIGMVKNRLKKAGDGKPRLFIHESCTYTITEFSEYAWPQGKDGKSSSEVPFDKNNHAMDVIRYMVMHLDHEAGVMLSASFG